MQALALLVAIVGGVILFVLLMALERRKWNCPKCGQTMHKTGKRGGFLWRNSEIHCTNCGHTKWYEPHWPIGP